MEPISKMSKAVTALVSSVLYFVGAFGVDVSFMYENMNWLLPAVTTFLVWLVPNTET